VRIQDASFRFTPQPGRFAPEVLAAPRGSLKNPRGAAISAGPGALPDFWHLAFAYSGLNSLITVKRRIRS
jgi:hypothetical protein